METYSKLGMKRLVNGNQDKSLQSEVKNETANSLLKRLSPTLIQHKRQRKSDSYNKYKNTDILARIKTKMINLAALYSIMMVLPEWSLAVSILPLVNSRFWFYFIGFSVFYQALSIAIEALILLNSNWIMNKLSPKAKEAYPTAKDFGMASTTQFTGLVHASLSSLLSLWIILVPSPLHQDHLFASSQLSSLHCVHSSALFFTELLDLVQQPHGLTTTYGRVILLHHILATIGFGLGAYGIGNYYISLILLSEISSIFLGTRWFLLQLNYSSTALFKTVETLFVFFFISIRIILGYFYVTPLFTTELLPIAMGANLNQSVFSFQHTSQVPLDTIQTVCKSALIMGIVYHFMNAFFLYQIIRMALKSSERNQSEKSGASEKKGDHHHGGEIASMPHE